MLPQKYTLKDVNGNFVAYDDYDAETVTFLYTWLQNSYTNDLVMNHIISRNTPETITH